MGPAGLLFKTTFFGQKGNRNEEECSSSHNVFCLFFYEISGFFVSFFINQCFLSLSEDDIFWLSAIYIRVLFSLNWANALITVFRTEGYVHSYISGDNCKQSFARLDKIWQCKTTFVRL
jgi:hypothetical protein